jgi:two-component system NtrC family sensor kinase
MNGITQLKSEESPENEKSIAEIGGDLEREYNAIKAIVSELNLQEEIPHVKRLANKLAQEIKKPTYLIACNLGIIGKYLEQLEDFIQAQSDLIVMVTEDGSSAGLLEKRRHLNLDHIVANGRELIRESLEGIVCVLTITESLDSCSTMSETEIGHTDENVT